MSQHQATFMHRVRIIVHCALITAPITITGIMFSLCYLFQENKSFGSKKPFAFILWCTRSCIEHKQYTINWHLFSHPCLSTMRVGTHKQNVKSRFSGIRGFEMRRNWRFSFFLPSNQPWDWLTEVLVGTQQPGMASTLVRLNKLEFINNLESCDSGIPGFKLDFYLLSS